MPIDTTQETTFWIISNYLLHSELLNVYSLESILNCKCRVKYIIHLVTFSYYQLVYIIVLIFYVTPYVNKHNLQNKHILELLLKKKDTRVYITTVVSFMKLIKCYYCLLLFTLSYYYLTPYLINIVNFLLYGNKLNYKM